MKLQFSISLSTFLVCMWVVTAAVAQQVATPAPQPGTLVGTVLDVNGGTVPGATVSLRDSWPGDNRRIVTQNNGFFQFGGVKPGLR